MTAAVGIAQSGVNNVSWRNRIINGGMVLDQRNSGASVSVANNAVTYTVDRWLVYSNNDGFCSMQQVSDAPAGFVKSLRFTTTTADSSLSATQRAMIQHRIEGFNASDFGWGAAGAQTVTLSFWVKSTLTGSFGGAIQNEAVNRAYPFSYTINSANTWEQKTITIPGDTTGTWATDNTCWARVVFGLGVGSTYSGTANSWAASDLNSVTGAVSVIGTLNATWQITGVQLERGTTATPFEYRDYGRELMMCQRYYEKSYRLDTTPGTNTTDGWYDFGLTSNGGSYVEATVPLMVMKRALPTITLYTTTSSGTWNYERNGASGTSGSAALISERQFRVELSVGAAWAACRVNGQWTASAEL